MHGSLPFRLSQIATSAKAFPTSPKRNRSLFAKLLFFYDNLGAFLIHDIVDIRLVSGYLGGAVISCWERMYPLVQAEREKRRRAEMRFPNRWQEYTEVLYDICKNNPPNGHPHESVAKLIRQSELII